MKKAILVFSVLGLLLSFNAYALDNSFVNIRSRIFEESKQIKALLTTSKDAILLSSMWDSCLMTMRELDAYFHMLGIFNTIKQRDLDEDAVIFLSRWLSEVKAGSELNIRILTESAYPTESQAAIHIARLKNHFGELNKKIDSELNKISLFRESVKRKNK